MKSLLSVIYNILCLFLNKKGDTPHRSHPLIDFARASTTPGGEERIRYAVNQKEANDVTIPG